MDRKRKIKLERMLLPGAPPRKRQIKTISPERMPVILAEAKPSTSRSADMDTKTPITSKTVETALPDVDTKTGPITWEIIDTAPPDGDTMTFPPITLPITWEIVETSPLEIGAEQVICEPSTSADSLETSVISVFDSTYGDLMEEWLPLTELSDDEDDLTDYYLSSTGQIRYAVAEPASVADLTAYEALVLQVEDSKSDQVLRDIVTTDECYSFKWDGDRQTFLGQREVFTGTPGPTFEITDKTTPIEIFDKMFDVDFIDMLCIETNRYAEQKLALLHEQNKISSRSRFRRWTPTDRNEMISFLAIKILQGLYHQQYEESYFKYNGFGTMPYFSRIISYNRFLLLKTMLHFVDNDAVKDVTKLYKIRPVIDYFNRQFSSLYMPSQEIAIDESLLKWHGRLSFSQKISSKAAKVGIKTYELCESSSGYLWKFSVYAGKDKPRPTDRQNSDEQMNRPDEDETTDRPNDDRPTNATAKIVCDLIEPLLHLGHTLIMDNFYNSPLLLRHLKRQKTDCYGTLRLNREFVPESIKTLTKTDLRHGEAVAAYCSDLAILVWRDANLVSMISTYHNLQIGTANKKNKLTYKPSIVLDYNKNMGAIDKKDQFLSAQPIERVRNKVWYKKLFSRLYNAAIFNCYVIFATAHRQMTHRKFRTILAEDLIKRHKLIDLTTEYRLLNNRTSSTGSVTSPMKLGKRNLPTQTQTARPTCNLKHNHYPIKTGSKHTVCRFCPIKTRTSWKCEECDVNLCILGCFKAFHHSLDFPPEP